jgi:hypothetical protein
MNSENFIEASIIPSDLLNEQNRNARKLPTQSDLSAFPPVNQRTVLKTVTTGEIAIEQGADGIFLRFDCDCSDALPWCQAQCCGLPGTVVLEEELEKVAYPIDWDDSIQNYVLHRRSDGFCECLDRRSRRCGIYQDRPETCQQFHCTRGASQRGWKIANGSIRQSRIT